MILKKPYGLLIKYFRLIHLILTIPMIYLSIRTTNIYNFLDNYIKDGYTTNLKDIPSTYVNGFMYLAVILIIITVIAITYLMNAKKKSIRFYLLITIYFIALLSYIYLIYNLLAKIETKTIDSSVALMYRDISQITYYISYLIIGYTLIRGIGFDIKSFNFNEDLEDLDLSEEDSEEIEVNINIDRYEIERKIRSKIRDTKYYILENKLIFTFILIGVVLFSVASLILNVKVYNKYYKTNTVFQYNGFDVKVTDSMINIYDYKGNIIHENKAYLVVVAEFKNNSSSAAGINKDDFALYLDDNIVLYPKLDKSGNFIDVASPYYGGKLRAKTNNVICLVYELLNSQIKSEYEIRILIGTTKEKEILVGRYKKIQISPVVESKDIIKRDYKLKEEISFTGTPLLDSTLVVNSYELTNRYEYSYDYCLDDKCQPSVGVVGIDYVKTKGGILLVLETKLKLAKESNYASYDLINHNFYVDFAKLRYKNDKDVYNESGLINRTPTNLKDFDVFQVKADVANAKTIDLILNVRGKEMTIKLK